MKCFLPNLQTVKINNEWVSRKHLRFPWFLLGNMQVYNFFSSFWGKKREKIQSMKWKGNYATFAQVFINHLFAMSLLEKFTRNRKGMKIYLVNFTLSSLVLMTSL